MALAAITHFLLKEIISLLDFVGLFLQLFLNARARLFLMICDCFSAGCVRWLSLDLTFSFLEKVFLALVLGKELELAAVDGPPPLHPDHFYSVLVLHTQLDEGHRNQDGSPTQPSHAVNTDARLSGVTIIKSFFDEIEPLFKDFSGRCATVWEGKLCHGHPRLLEVVRLVCRVSGAN